jgi:SulP family sulfate permease
LAANGQSPDSQRADPLGAGRRVARNATAGALGAVMMVAYAGSCTNLIYSGRLAQFGGQGMLGALVSTIVTVLVLSRLSSFRLSLGGPDSNPSAILAVSTAAIASVIIMDSGPYDPSLLATVLLFVSASALGCGLLLVLIGERRLGRCVRYVPHPVIGGFLGGTGYLLLSGAYKMLTGVGPGTGLVAALSAVAPLSLWTAAATGVALFLLMRVSKHHLVIPLVLFAATLAFYAVLGFRGTPVAEARAQGLLMEPLHLGNWVNALHFSYGAVRWGLVLEHWNDFAVMTVVVIITCLLNATSVDVSLGSDVNIDRELRALGVANIVSGLCGGMVAVNSFNRTVLNQRSGASSPAAARFCAAFILVLVLVAPGLVGYIPRPVLTGLILYLGLSLFVTWVWDSRSTMPVSDHLIVVAIVGIIAVIGVVSGVLVGVGIACLNFVFAFSQSPAVKYAFTGATRRSNVERKPHEIRSLSENGAVLRGFVLQGFLFFGTASTVLDEIRKVLDEARFIVVDFWFVHEIDSSSAIALRKIRNLSVERGVFLVVCGVSPQIARRLGRANFNLDDPLIRVFPDLDHGLEWCENQIIAAQAFTSGPFVQFTGGLNRFREGPMAAYLDPIAVRAGELVVRQGDPSDALYIVDGGQVSVYLRAEGGNGAKGTKRRLRSYGVGTVVGEMGFYTGDPRSTDVVADVDSVLLVLSRDRMLAFERESAPDAQDFHRYVIYTLALRLRSANEEIQLLL